ncbi:MAG: extracellular solute-binding protein [Promicromonosporaceae bacterium]|nr:extracellular solute-binding protein [Promicromonosporaceae bacterium]
MTRKIRGAAVLALGATVALTISACSSGSNASSGSSADSTKPATLTVWENNTSGTAGPQFWKDAAAAFQKAHPNVKVNIVGVQNEDLDGKLQTAMNGGNPPDVFLQRGGGKLADMVSASMVKDITSSIDSSLDIPKGAFGADTLNGKIYAMPMDVTPGGFWYSKTLFQQAGITDTPKTWDDFTADIAKLKAAKITPIALGGKDAWPAAHYFYWLSLRECSSDTLEKAAGSANLSDPCFTKAATDLQTFAALKPFQDGFLTTPAQQTPDSADGLIANHKAAMQLIGAWESGTVGSLTPDKKPLPDLGYFPFPEVSGGQGTPGSMMAGVDGYSCSAKAPEPACTDFLNFLGSADQQKAYNTANSSLPASSGAASALTLTDDNKSALAAYQAAPYVSLWLDSRLGQNIGNALNQGVVNLLAGQGTPAAVIKAANDAAAKG